MTLTFHVMAIFFAAEILLFLGMVLWVLLPDLRWFRRLKGGTWYYTVSKDHDGNVASWWTRHQPKTENILIVEFN